MKELVLIYGTTGYTGALIAEAAVAQGLHPIIAGRNSHKLAPLAEQLGITYRAFSFDDQTATDHALADIAVVLNCAGPFAHTAKPMAQACIRTHTHYLDIAGEIPEFEALLPLDEVAQKANIMLLPGVGFGVVPTDCVAAYLKEQLPSATHLTLAFQAEGGVSQGTAATILRDIHRKGFTRQNGQLVAVPAAWKSHRIDFGQGAIQTVTNPWRGDISTAFRSTGIPNIETYTAFPSVLQMIMKTSNYLGWLIGSKPIQNLLQKQVRSQPAGPTSAERKRGYTRVWGEVKDSNTNQRVTALLRGPEAYDFTALTAIATVKRILAGAVSTGFQTPATAYGPAFISEIDGVELNHMATA